MARRRGDAGLAGVHRVGLRAQRGPGGRPRQARADPRRLPGAGVPVRGGRAGDADVRSGRPAATVAQRPDPPSRRARPGRRRRAPALGHRPPGDARRAHRRRRRACSARRRRRTPAACGARIFDQIERRDIAAMERLFTAIHEGLHADGPAMLAGDDPDCRRASAATSPTSGSRTTPTTSWSSPRRPPVPAAGVFTRSRFTGPSVTISREHLARRPGAGGRRRRQERQRRQRPGRDGRRRGVVAAVADRLGCAAGRGAHRLDRRDRPPLPARPHPRRRGGDARPARRRPTPWPPPGRS